MASSLYRMDGNRGREVAARMGAQYGEGVPLGIG